MARDAAEADRQAAAYWRRVAHGDTTATGSATTAARDLSAAAQREDHEPSTAQNSSRKSAAKLSQ